MTTFFERFTRYAVGLVLGIAISYFFFGDRDIQCTYFPNQRVLADVHRKSWHAEGEALSTWQVNYQGDSNLLGAFLLRGDVDFSKSLTSTRHDVAYPRYRIELTWQDEPMDALFEVRGDSVVMLELGLVD